jgi:hypothetical protein
LLDWRTGQDLADLCFPLWCAAGRKKSEYNDMAIEFGESRHSGVEVNELIADALGGGDYDTPETTYLDVLREQSQATEEQGRQLMDGLIALIGGTSTLIAHGSDLRKLQMRSGAFGCCGLQPLRGKNEWYIRTASTD